MRKAVAGLVMLRILTSCGPGYEKPASYPFVCESKCFRLVRSANPIDCEAFASNEAMALRYLEYNNIVNSSIFCHNGLNHVMVNVRADEHSWADSEGQNVLGLYYSTSQTIEIAKDSQALLHEMIHRLEFWRDYNYANSHANQHYKWEEKGYYKLDDDFTDKAIDLESTNGSQNGSQE